MEYCSPQTLQTVPPPSQTSSSLVMVGQLSGPSLPQLDPYLVCLHMQIPRETDHTSCPLLPPILEVLLSLDAHSIGGLDLGCSCMNAAMTFVPSTLQVRKVSSTDVRSKILQGSRQL